MLGAIFGDVVGSIYEFHNIRTKKFLLFSPQCKFTDDSVMTVAVAEALLEYDRGQDLSLYRQNLIAIMHRYGKRYPNAGYGGRFAVWLKAEDTKPYNSFGNGSAMRVSPVAWIAQSLEETVALATATSDITHDHPEGIKGAVVTAGATHLARTGASMEEIKAFVERYYDLNFTLDEIRPTYAFNETCQKTVPQAMQAFFESDSFEDAIRNSISIGGDSDTLGAICGAVAGAYYGLSSEEEETVRSYLNSEILDVIDRFSQISGACKDAKMASTDTDPVTILQSEAECKTETASDPVKFQTRRKKKLPLFSRIFRK